MGSLWTSTQSVQVLL